MHIYVSTHKHVHRHMYKYIYTYKHTNKIAHTLTPTCVLRHLRPAGRPNHRWRDDIVEQLRAVWARIAEDREIWMTLAEGFFLQWKDTAKN